MAPRRTVIPIEHPRLRGYNPLDLITGAYLGLTAILLAFTHDRVPNGSVYLMIHVGMVAVIALLGCFPRRGNIFVQFFRDTYPMWFLPLFYGEIAVLNRLLWSGYFDATVLQWEQSLFGGFPSLLFESWLPSRLLSEFLHFSYMTYYLLVPILGFWLYLRGRAEVCRVFATTVMLTFFACYAIFILFPVAGPYYVFPRQETARGFFPPLVHALLDSGASRGAAFPSSHVAGAVAVLWMTARFERPLLPLMATLATGIFFGTVYGGFHYGVDALAGLALGVAFSLIGPRAHAWLLRRARLGPMRFRFPHLRASFRVPVFGKARRVLV
ncbi:MAG: phosphatase PAP2 family protein, partial [Candidatus Eisenbacteria bacterium]|nr:phosphatase PAP2 family protein [Candidatus Eisenbacteria bacterium]